MALFTDNFDRADTAAGSGLGTVPGGPAWEHLSGSWRILSNRADAGTVNAAIAVIAGGGGDADVSASVSSSGGDCVYARVVDASNWVRARVRTYQVLVQSGYTQYEYTNNYSATVNGFTHTSQTTTWGVGPSSISHSHPVNYTYTEYEWFHRTSADFGGGDGHDHTGTTYSTSTSACPWGSYTHTHSGFVSNPTHSHSIASCYRTGNTRDVTGSRTETHTMNRTSSTQTGNSRFVDQDYYETRYQVILEKSVAGTVTVLGTASTSAPTSLRLRAQGTALSVFVNGATSAALTANDGTHSTATRHGIGRGPSDLNGTNLDDFSIDTLNTPPTAPGLVAPVGNVPVNRGGDVLLDWTFADPDTSDSQSAYEARWRLVGAAAWTTTGKVASATTSRTVGAGTFPAGDHEWQVDTYDAQGLKSPPSASGFFTAATVPAPPTILDPLNNAGIPTSTYLASWSAAAQDAYEMQVLDGASVVHASGVVDSASTRAYTLPFPTNGVTRTVRLRVRSGGLWSAWTTHAVTVSYTAPAVPAVRLALLRTDRQLDGTFTQTVVEPGETSDSIAVDVYNSTAWGHGGSTVAKNAASPPLVDLEALGVPRCLFLPGSAGNYVSTPDLADLRITGDLDLRAHVALEDSTPGAVQTCDAKWGAAGARSYALQVTPAGLLRLQWSTDGTATLAVESTVAIPATDAARLAVRAFLDVDNGASGRTGRFWTSTDNVTWTQLGTDVVQAGVTSVFAGTAPLTVGSLGDGTALLKGKVLFAEVRAGIDGPVVARYDATAHDSSSPNLVTEPTTAADYAGSGTSAVTAEAAFVGASSLKVTRTGSIAEALAGVAAFTPTAGVTYTASTYVKKADATARSFRVIARHSGGIDTAGTAVTAGDWTRLTTTFTTASTATVNVLVGITGAATGESYYVDAVQVEVGSVATAYRPHPDTTLDTTGKAWTVSRSGDATAEIVDRNTWAFTGSEYLTLPDRDDLDFGAGEGLTLAARALTRTTVNGRIAQKGDALSYHLTANGAQWFYEERDAGGFQSVRATAAGNNGAWHVVGGSRAGGATAAWFDGAQAATATFRDSDLRTADPLRVGLSGAGTSPYRGLISWVALFRRTLTTAEHAALAAWDGTVATEPAWLRDDATLYVNADDPQQRGQYTARNLVLNLARTVSEGGVASDLPEVVENNVYRSHQLRDGTWTDPIRVAVGIAPDGTYIDRTPASSVPYKYRVDAVGANNTSVSSDWVL